MRHLLIVFLAIFLTACAGSGGRQAPAPVDSRGAAPVPAQPVAGPAEHGEVVVSAYRPSAPAQRVIRAQPNRAVDVLLKRARDQQRAGDLGAATVSLERALRISPQNGVLWNQLAHVRAEQAEYALVAQLAAKSNQFARDDHGLQADNWRLIAEAKRALGDGRAAAAARRRAGELTR